jgi:hypothetical protein
VPSVQSDLVAPVPGVAGQAQVLAALQVLQQALQVLEPDARVLELDEQVLVLQVPVPVQEFYLRLAPPLF